MAIGRHFPHRNKFHTGRQKCHPSQRNLPYVASNISRLTSLSLQWRTYPAKYSVRVGPIMFLPTPPQHARMKRMSDSKMVLQIRKYSWENIFFNIQSSTDLESDPITQVQNAYQPTERTTSASLHLFSPQVPEDHLQSSLVSAEDMAYSYWSSQSCIYFSKINQIFFWHPSRNRT